MARGFGQGCNGRLAEFRSVRPAQPMGAVSAVQGLLKTFVAVAAVPEATWIDRTPTFKLANTHTPAAWGGW